MLPTFQLPFCFVLCPEEISLSLPGSALFPKLGIGRQHPPAAAGCLLVRKKSTAVLTPGLVCFNVL